jgi:ABC-type transport system involved in multi-copper enzyme maturation permease subunit
LLAVLLLVVEIGSDERTGSPELVGVLEGTKAEPTPALFPDRAERAGRRAGAKLLAPASLALAVRWDWFKLSRRWLPWILLAVLLIMSQLAVWANYFGFVNLRRESATVAAPAAEEGGSPSVLNCRDVLAGDSTKLPPSVNDDVLPALQDECQQVETRLSRQLSQYYAALTLPGSLPTALNISVTVGIILLAILTAGHIGSEYAWDTLRTNLSHGLGRWQFVASRLVLLAILAGLALLIVAGATAVSSTIAGRLVAHPAEFKAAVTWARALGLLARGWVALVPYIAFAGFFTILARSAAAGMAITIGYHLGEQIVVATVSGLFGWFRTVARYLLAQNIAAWVGLSSLGQGQTALSRAHALTVLVVYTAAFIVAALYLFQSRDVTGTSGS